jgi:hypothetical protein
MNIRAYVLFSYNNELCEEYCCEKKAHCGGIKIRLTDFDPMPFSGNFPCEQREPEIGRAARTRPQESG